jgi:hypothetical protein
MADGKIKISELEEALQLNDNAEFPYSQDNGGVPTTFKAPANQIARKVAEGSTFTNLTTTAKTLVGAINELSHLGNPIIIGTTAPTSSQGADGNIYVQYTAGTGGADDEVDGIFVKIDGAWCEIQTGGGSGTTDYEDLSNKPQVNSVELVGNKSLDDLGIMPALLSKTVSGAIAHFTDGADNIPVKSLVSQIVAVESGNGQPKSPDNPYTISGFDNGVVTRCGKNLANFTDGYGISTSGEIVLNAKRTSTVTPIKVDNTKPYVFTFAGSNIVSAYAVWNNNTLVRRITGFGGGTIDVSGGNLVYLSCYNSSESSSTPPTTKADCTPQLEQNTTATTFEAYNGNTYTFAFGQTIYGGHFDNKGNLVVTHIIKKINEISWTYRTISGVSGYVFLSNEITGIKQGQSPIMSSIYEIKVNRNFIDENYQVAISNNTTAFDIIVKDDDFTDVSGFLSSRGNETFLFELATPITLSITSQDIPTLLENNIFSNCGDVEVEYYISNSDDIVDLIKSAGSGGHTIVDDAGTDLAQRTNLQFKGAYSEDNSTDDTTEVNVVREMTKAEFDQLTEEEKIGLINITDITGGNDDRFQPVIYSEEEREIGVWVDGKPLYEKTIINSNPSYTQVGSIYECNTSVDFSGVDYFMIVNATALNANSTRPVNNTRTDITAMGYVSVGKSTNVIYTAFNTDVYTKLVFTLRYTKTTDTAGSGQWTPQGVPAHHYSENEQVVGTWIDGSTIYEKTFDLSSVSLTNATWSNNVLGTSGSNIKIRKFSGTFNITGGGYTNEPYADYIYYRSEDEYFTAVINGAGDDINLRPQINGVTMTAGVCTIRYTKSST